MILGEKIANLRKKNGWSQEELAEMMHVSRQAVSKWEGSQSIPDIDRILQLSALFSVTTDYLLKDEEEVTEYTKEDPTIRQCRLVSLQEANEYLELRRDASPKIALAVFLCIISPIIMLALGTISDYYPNLITENTAGFLGIAALLLLVAVGVAIFIYCDSKCSYFHFLEEEEFEIAYGVSGMIREKQMQYRDTYTKHNIMGTVMCILAPIILLSAAFLSNENELLIVFTLCSMLFVIAIAVYFFVKVGVIWEAMQKLLQEGDYTKTKKKFSQLNGTIAAVYWIAATALFLYYGLKTGDFASARYFWPVAGLIYAAIIVIMDLIQKKE